MNISDVDLTVNCDNDVKTVQIVQCIDTVRNVPCDTKTVSKTTTTQNLDPTYEPADPGLHGKCVPVSSGAGQGGGADREEADKVGAGGSWWRRRRGRTDHHICSKIGSRYDFKQPSTNAFIGHIRRIQPR